MRQQWTESAVKDLDSVEWFYRETAAQRIAADNVLKIIASAETLLKCPIAVVLVAYPIPASLS